MKTRLLSITVLISLMLLCVGSTSADGPTWTMPYDSWSSGFNFGSNPQPAFDVENSIGTAA
jgi:hypothetical protein